MADHEKINMLPWDNTFSIKEEECQGDNFIENKVYISETIITTGDAELQGPSWHGKIKECDESTSLGNIKTELASSDVIEVQNDNVKAEEISDVNKIEFDNGLLYCEQCEAYYKDYCIECGMLVHILNRNASSNEDSGARGDIPNDVLEIQECFGQTGIYASKIIPAGVNFGPFTGLSTTDSPWEMNGETFCLDKNKSKCLNWMQYINPTSNTSEQNMCVFQCEGNVYYQSTRQIQTGEELLVYFGGEYGNSTNKIVREDFVITMKEIIKDVFACTFCCLGFSSKLYLAKHKTICVKDISGMFSVEELTQCPFCKICLNLREYHEHHLAYCGEKNVRKETPGINADNKGLHEIYKCKQCKYKTKYKAVLRNHTKNQHYEVKYKCGICNRSFETEEYLRLHLENTHTCVGGNEYSEYSRSDYLNTHIKVEESNSQTQEEIFMCSLCVFRTKYKLNLKNHIKSKHLEEFDYKCESCEFKTNSKNNLEQHVKTKHLKEFDFKCDKCEFRTNNKSNLEIHVNAKHTKEIDYKCDICEFRANRKYCLKEHIKAKHLKEYDYKCDKCTFRTNNKSNLETHINAKHLKEYDYKCEICEFKTNRKYTLKGHMKTIHLKEYDYKCDKCKFKTNNKSSLKIHVNAKHSKEFVYNCNSCEFKTNRKYSLKAHTKTIHLKEFDYKCESCEFRANRKFCLKEHIKTIHLNEFYYKCDKCKFRTNNKRKLEIHINAKHSKEFVYKCEKCEFGTNCKYSLKAHIKTIHLKEFDYKCESCEYRTNRNSSLTRHIKKIHLKI